MSGIGDINMADVQYSAYIQTTASKGAQSSVPLNPLAAVESNNSIQPTVSPEDTMVLAIVGKGGGDIVSRKV